MCIWGVNVIIYLELVTWMFTLLELRTRQTVVGYQTLWFPFQHYHSGCVPLSKY